MTRPTIMLGIETSCDETAVAIVDDSRQIHANLIKSQFELHSPYGGVVPEIAARAHGDILDQMVKQALKEAGVTVDDIDAVAATAGPGLIGGVLVGLSTAKGFALGAQKPLYPINHLEGHALSARLMEPIAFPYLLLLISGGHCQLLSVEGVGKYSRLGTTIDDAAGEAFDKGAKLLELGQPGGPLVESWAREGREGQYSLPRPLVGNDHCDFSFSGLKTALSRVFHDIQGAVTNQNKRDLCAELQAAICDCLIDRSANAMKWYQSSFRTADNQKPAFVVAGGVAANQYIGNALSALADKNGFTYHAPPPWLCTDNAAMIAWAGLEQMKAGKFNDDSLQFAARARWPLDEVSSPKLGGGKKGARA